MNQSNKNLIFNKRKSTDFNQTTNQTINGVSYQQSKRSVSQVPSNFNFFLRQNQRADINHSQLIADQILSSKSNKYFEKSQSHLRSGIRNTLYQQKAYHNNQYRHMVCNTTIPKPQKTRQQTTFVKQKLKLTLANNLEKILFNYNGKHARILYNNKLKIKNDSPVKVSLKITCTAPSHYEVRPYSKIVLFPQQFIDVQIEMKLYAYDFNHLIMKHNLSRYQNDKFKISYRSSEYQPNIWYQSGQKVLPVIIEDTEDEKMRSKGLIENQTYEEMKIIEIEKNIQMYRRMIQKTKKKVDLIDFEIKEKERHNFYNQYFTKSLFWLFVIFGLFIGYWIG